MNKLLLLPLLLITLSGKAQDATSKIIADAHGSLARTAQAAAQQADIALKNAQAVQSALEEAQRKQIASVALEPKALDVAADALKESKKSLASAEYSARAAQAAADQLAALASTNTDLEALSDATKRETFKAVRVQEKSAADNAATTAKAAHDKYSPALAKLATAEASINAAVTETAVANLGSKLITAVTDTKAAVADIQSANLAAHAAYGVALAVAGKQDDDSNSDTPPSLRETASSNSLFLGNRSVRLAVGLGASHDLNESYDYTLASPDYRLIRDNRSKLNGVASAVLAYSPTYYYKALDVEGKATGPSYVVRSKLSGLASVNILDLNKEFGFTRHLNLGLGIGYLFGDTRNEANSVILGFFVEATYERFLYDYYNDQVGKPLPGFGSTATAPTSLNSLDRTNNLYFHDKPVYSAGIKLVYLINGKNAPSDQATENAVKNAK